MNGMMSSLTRRQITILGSLLIGICLGLVAFGQTTPETNRGIEKRRVNLYYHLGSVEIPKNFSGEVKANWTDAWAGFLRSEDGSFEIEWRAGTIVYVREKRKNDIESIGTELLGSIVFEIAILQEKSGKTLVAKTGWLEFSSKIESDEQEEYFWSILATYEKERCRVCSSLPIKVDN